MEPIEEFEWSLQALQKMFKSILDDPFQSGYRYGPQYYFFVSFFLFTFVCVFSTMLDRQHDFAIRFNIGGLLPGYIQVQ